MAPGVRWVACGWRATLGCLPLACGAAAPDTAPVAAPLATPNAASNAAPGAAPAAPQRCRLALKRVSLRNVGVTLPLSQEDLRLDLADVLVAIELGEGAEQARLEVLEPLRFEASVMAASLELRLAGPVELLAGRLRLAEGAQLSSLGVSGDRVQVSLRDWLDADVKPAPLAPCQSLSADGMEDILPPEAWP